MSSFVEEYSVELGPARSGQTVVVVPYGGDLGAGFARARLLLDGGVRVRLVGVGVTARAIWPAWVDDGVPLTLSELRAHGPRSTIAATAMLRAEIESWLDVVFAGTVEGQRGGDTFFSSACLRVFEAQISAHADALGVAELYGAGDVHLVAEAWAGVHALAAEIGKRGGRLIEPAARRRFRLPWSLRVGAAGSAALLATIADQTMQFVRSAPSRKRLRELRARAALAPPSVWVVVVADWLRFSRIVVRSVIVPELEAGRNVGVLLAGSLVPGERDEANMRKRIGTELWTGLGDVRQQLDRCVVDQISGLERWRDLGTAGRRFVGASSRALRAVAVGGPRIGSGSTSIDLDGHARQLAVLATLDVARAIIAELATRQLLERFDFRGQDVVFATSSTAEMATPDLLLQRVGARTIEVSHGSIGTGEPGARQSRASTVCVWNEADARVLAPLGQHVVAAGMPRFLPRRAHDRNGTLPSRRLLILTNYAHFYSRIDGRLPFEPFQLDLLRAVADARDVLGPEGEVRWRPHPADDVASVERTLKTVEGIHVSRQKRLEEDVAWSDLIVCTPSSSVFEVLLVDIPVFLHVLPEYSGTEAADFVDDARRFVGRADLRAKLAACVAAMRRGDPGALAPEANARRSVFGPTEEPTSLADAFRWGGALRD